MSVRKCPRCGEVYSTSYKECPFCEEEDALAEGRSLQRRGGRRVARKEPSVVGPLLTMLLVLIVCVLIYFFFGDAIREKFFGQETPKDPTEQVQPDVPKEPEVPPEGEEPVIPTIDPDAPIVPEVPAEPTEPEMIGGVKALTLSSEDFTCKAGEKVTLKVLAGGTDYHWSSSDDGIASVKDGVVTAISGGTVTITARKGEEYGTCIARVKGGAAPVAPAQPGDETQAAASISKTDFTCKVGETVRLTVTGGSAVWSSANSAIATVSDGTIKAIAKGDTTVTATVGGKELKCIVRVK